MFLVTLVVLMLLVVVSVSCVRLRQKQETNQARLVQLQNQIAAEEERTQELEELRKYTQTNAYIEEVAKEKLGLVHPGEIIFKIKR
jgi:cell division protein FtsB